jgi:hypothetical protein
MSPLGGVRGGFLRYPISGALLVRASGSYPVCMILYAGDTSWKLTPAMPGPEGYK